jgi:DNA polymerase-1
VHFLQCQNYEADDILGHMAKWANANGYDSILVTGDRDSFQLASDDTKILYAKRESVTPWT